METSRKGQFLLVLDYINHSLLIFNFMNTQTKETAELLLVTFSKMSPLSLSEMDYFVHVQIYRYLP